MAPLSRFRRARVVVAALLAWVISGTAHAADVSINDAGDVLHTSGCAVTGTGTCTLRDAITFANSNPGPDVIWLAKVVYSPRSALPPITESATLNGTYYPVPGFGPVIDGTLAGSADGLVLAADQSAILGVEIRNFEGTGIVVLGSSNTVGRFIPPYCTGGCPIQGVTVKGNRGHGIEIRGGASNTLGDVYAAVNGGHGFYVHAGATFNRIQDPGHYAGVAYHNQFAGVRIGDGPTDRATYGNTIDLRALYGNGGLPIDLGGDGATANDPLDADSGPNGLQNFPMVTSAVTNADNTATVAGTMNGAPNATYTLRFYRADTGSAPFIDDASVATDAGGSAFFSAVLRFFLQTPTPAGIPIPLVATATDAAGSTSELSGPVVWAPPTSPDFHTIPPCRVLDTRLDPRDAVGLLGGPALVSGRPRLLQGIALCGIPETARALAVNVTVTNATSAGHVHVAATPWPADTSTINFRAGQTRANSALVTLDPFGWLAANPVLEGSGTVDLILDVTGYFE